MAHISIQAKKIPHLLILPFPGFTGKYKVIDVVRSGAPPTSEPHSTEIES